jgi:hypothetical protein
MNPFRAQVVSILNMNDYANIRRFLFSMLALNHHPDGTHPLNPLPLNLYHVQKRERLSV